MPSKKTWTDTEKTTQASSKTTPAKKTSTSTTKTTATKTATANKTTTAKASPVKKATTSPATKAPASKASTTTKKPTSTKATTTSTAKKTTTTATKATTSKAASPAKKTPVKATAPKKTTTSSKVATKKVEEEEINEDYIPCCMKFDTIKYDNKTHRWKNKKFVKDSVFAKPFGVDKKVAEMKTKIEEWRWITRTRPENVLVLFNAANSFKWEIYISIDNYVDWMNYVELSWVYFSKVYDASFDTANKLMEDMEEYLKKKGKDAHNYYIHYAYCPDCAKHYGDNYTVLFAEIE